MMILIHKWILDMILEISHIGLYNIIYHHYPHINIHKLLEIPCHTLW